MKIANIKGITLDESNCYAFLSTFILYYVIITLRGDNNEYDMGFRYII